MQNIQGRVLKNEFSGENLTKSNPLDAGLDIKSAEDITIWPRSRCLIDTGLFLEIPKGCVGLIWSRSGLAAKKGIEAGAGCIDATYRGQVKVLLHNHSDEKYCIKRGERIAQLLTIPVVLANYVESEALGETERGTGGFGSSGK